MKVCSKCKVEKDEGCFHKQKASKDGLSPWCHCCRKEYEKERKFRDGVKEKEREYNKKRYSLPGVKAAKKECSKRRYAIAENREAIRKQQKDRYNNPKNKERDLQRKKDYYSIPEVREARREYCKKHEKERKKIDPLFKLRCNLGCLIYVSIMKQGYSKKSKTCPLLGADFETVKKHLENTWFQNYGIPYSGQEVHVDHIIPCSAAKTEEALIALQHYTNLQYLTPEDNLAKSNKMPDELSTQAIEVK